MSQFVAANIVTDRHSTNINMLSKLKKKKDTLQHKEFVHTRFFFLFTLHLQHDSKTVGCKVNFKDIN